MNLDRSALAPVLLTVYDRKDHLQRAISSLLRCPEAKNTVIYVSSDAASRAEDESAIQDVRTYISEVTGFKQVVSLFHRENLGLQRSYESALHTLFAEHDSFIFLEDDVEVSSDFLAYMNDALTYYKDEPKIFCISAFSFSCLYSGQETYESAGVYFVNRFCPWGFAIWRSRMFSGELYSIDQVEESLYEHEFVQRLRKNGSDLLPSFATQVARRKMLVLDYLNTYHMVRNDLFTVVPWVSKSFNHGHDGSGTRTVRNARFLKVSTDFLSRPSDYILTDFESDGVNYQILQRHFVGWKNDAKYVLWKMGILSVIVNTFDKVRAMFKR